MRYETALRYKIALRRLCYEDCAAKIDRVNIAARLAGYEASSRLAIR